MRKDNNMINIVKRIHNLLIFLAIIIIILSLNLLLVFINQKISRFYHIIFLIILILLISLLFFLFKTEKSSEDVSKNKRLSDISLQVLSNFVGVNTYRHLFSRLMRVLIDHGIIFTGTAFLYDKKEQELTVKYAHSNTEKFHYNKKRLI